MSKPPYFVVLRRT